MGFPSNATRPFAGLNRIQLAGLRFRLIDAKNQVVGRLATHIATMLQGKDKPSFDPSKDNGDVCIVYNAKDVVLTGKKWDKKMYRHHTGFPGGLREVTAAQLWTQDPTDILRKAVRGMLPKNELRRDRMRKLRIFPTQEHAFQQFPTTPFSPPVRSLKDRRLGWALPLGFDAMNREAYERRLRASRRLPPPPSVSFDDLLSKEEKEMIEGQQQGDKQ